MIKIILLTFAVGFLSTQDSEASSPHLAGILVAPIVKGEPSLEHASHYIKVNPKTLKPVEQRNCKLFEAMNPMIKYYVDNKIVVFGCLPNNNRLELSEE